MYCWGLDDPASSKDPVGITRTGVAVEVLQLLTSVFAETCPRLYIVTQGVQVVSDMDTISSMAQTPVVGLARVAFNEYPALRCTLLDVTAMDPNIKALVHEILADDREDDVVLRDDGRYVHRLERLAVDAAVSDRRTVTADAVEAFRLHGTGRPTFQAMPIPIPQVREVVVGLEYINSSSVQLEAGATTEEVRGYFATGTVTAVGEAVGKWKIGDKVLIAAEGRPASHVVCPIERVFSVDLYRGLTIQKRLQFPRRSSPRTMRCRRLLVLFLGRPC